MEDGLLNYKVLNHETVWVRQLTLDLATQSIAPPHIEPSSILASILSVSLGGGQHLDPWLLRWSHSALHHNIAMLLTEQGEPSFWFPVDEV